MSEVVTQRWMTATRYYVLRVQQDLFGDWELIKSWGGRSSSRGRSQVVPTSSAVDAIAALSKESKRRARRGYRLDPRTPADLRPPSPGV